MFAAPMTRYSPKSQFAQGRGASACGGLLVAILPLLAMFAGGPAMAGSQVVNSLEIQSASNGGLELHIRFNAAMRYLNHAPRKKGETLQIRLKPIKAAVSGDVDFDGQSTMSWKPTADIPLVEVAYEGDVRSLILKFNRTVTYTVRSSPSMRSIVVTIQASRAKKRSATATPAPAPKIAASAGRIDLSHPYVVNLLSSVRRINPSKLRMPSSFRGRRLYTTSFVKDGKRWNRLRLGFYPTAQAARAALKSVLSSYPGAWMAKASVAERRASAATAIQTSVAAAPAPKSPAKQAATSKTPPGALPAGGLAKLMDEANIAMTAREYRRAVQLYTKVLQYPDKPEHQPAQELLGLARERSGQLAHAKAEYETYLRLYPKGEGADRVRQRLAGLLTARSKPRDKLRVGTRGKDEWQVSAFGGFSQYYSYSESTIGDLPATVTRSDLNTDLDISTRVRKQDYEFGARFNGGYVSQFRDTGDDVSRISTLYMEAIDRNLGLSTRVGRQRRNTGGVLGRFDGAVIEYQFLPKARFDLVGGYPVDRSTELAIDTDRRFYGVGLNFGTFADSWDFNLYGINQEVNGIIDRQAVGGEVRYFDDGSSFFSLVDYDVSYGQLNIALLSTNLTFENQATAGLTLDYRNSPILTTTNAIQGQGVEEISDLLKTMSEAEVRALAEDRTARSRSATLSASHPLGEAFQVSGDFTLSNLSGTDGSGGVPATPGTGNEYFYSSQLIASGLLMEGDVNIFGLRYADASNADTWTITLDARYPVTRKWRIKPRFRADFKQNNDDDGEQIRLRPSLRSDYRPTKWMRLDLEAGMEWTEDSLAGNTTSTIGYNFTLGYRVNF